MSSFGLSWLGWARTTACGKTQSQESSKLRNLDRNHNRRPTPVADSAILPFNLTYITSELAAVSSLQNGLHVLKWRTQIYCPVSLYSSSKVVANTHRQVNLTYPNQLTHPKQPLGASLATSTRHWVACRMAELHPTKWQSPENKQDIFLIKSPFYYTFDLHACFPGLFAGVLIFGLLVDLKSEYLVVAKSTGNGFRAAVNPLWSVEEKGCVSFHISSLSQHRCVKQMVKKLGGEVSESLLLAELDSLNIRVHRVLRLRLLCRNHDLAKDRPQSSSLYRWHEGLRDRKWDPLQFFAVCDGRWSPTWPQKAHCNVIAASV